MPQPVQSEMIGLEGMLGVLRELPENLQKNALRSVSRAGAVALRKEALVQLGLVMGRSVSQDDVIIKARRSPRGMVRSEHNVGPPTRKPQLRWLHNGTTPHEIATTHADVLASADEIYATRMLHPGQPPRPWLQRAYFLSKNASVRAMGRAMAKALARQTKVLASKKYRSRELRTLRRHFRGAGTLFG